jgi:hypothetical protein
MKHAFPEDRLDGQVVVSYQIDGSDLVKALAQDLSMQRSKSSAAQVA